MIDPKKSYCHRGGEPGLLGASVPEHFAGIVARHSHSNAVVSLPQRQRLTYAELSARIDELARGLMGLGFTNGDRIGIWSTNNVEWLVLQMATARIGAILVNINPAYRPRELIYALQRSEVQGLFVIPAFRHSDYVSMLLETMPQLRWTDRSANETLPLLRQVVLYDPANPMDTERPAPGFKVWSEVTAAAHAISRDQLEQATALIDRDDPVNIQFTSGTTGFPKAVVLTHHNILNNAWFSAQSMHLGPMDRLAVPVPFYHCFGMVLSNLLCLSVGACIVIPCEHFDAGKVLEAVAAERCTTIHGVPTMFLAELEQTQFDRYDLTSLRTGIMAGAPCSPVLMRRVIEEMHCAEILIGYGQTEASPLTHLTSRDDDIERRTETVGVNLPHQEVKVVALDSGLTVARGEIGEICFRGYHIMRGYYGDDKATQDAIDAAGWLHSGDLGCMDEHGYVRITGRLKEMIIRGGENIYPREIEELLFEHPKISEAAVFGIPDEVYGEQVVVWIRLNLGETMDEGAVQEYLRGPLAHFKIPETIHFVDRFPMTVTGKLQKFRMREIEQQASGAKHPEAEADARLL